MHARLFANLNRIADLSCDGALRSVLLAAGTIRPARNFVLVTLHCDACPEPEKKPGPQVIRRSRDGPTIRLHLAVDDAGRALRLIATEGQVSDISCADELVEHLRTGAVIADKGYDSNAFVESIRATPAKAVIPPRSNRKTRRRYTRCIGRGTSWNAFSVVSNIFAVSSLATTSSQVTISPLLRLRVPLDDW